MLEGMGKYHAFVLNRKGVNNLLIPLPKRIENVDTTNSVLISMLMAWEDCYGLSVFDQEGTSTASESERVGRKVLELVKEMEEIDEAAAASAAAKEAEALRKRVEDNDRSQAESQVQQQQQWGQPQPQQIQQTIHHQHPQMHQHLPQLQMQHLHHPNQPQYPGSPAYMTPTAEYGGVDLMAALGPKLGIVGNNGGNNSGYNSGDGGYTSAASGTGGKGRKITLNELFGKPLG